MLKEKREKFSQGPHPSSVMELHFTECHQWVIHGSKDRLEVLGSGFPCVATVLLGAGSWKHLLRGKSEVEASQSGDRTYLAGPSISFVFISGLPRDLQPMFGERFYWLTTHPILQQSLQKGQELSAQLKTEFRNSTKSYVLAQQLEWTHTKMDTHMIRVS